MREFALSGAIVTAVFACAAINRAWAWWRAVPSFSHQSYEPEPRPCLLSDDEEAQWAAIEAAYLAAKGDS